MATLGYTEIGTGGEVAISPTSTILIDIGTMSENGTLDSATFYDPLSAANANFKIGLFKSNGDGTWDKVWQQETSSGSGAGWVTVNADNSSLYSGSTYAIALTASATLDIRIKIGPTDTGFYRRIVSGTTYSTSFNSTLTEGSTYQSQISAYITYTPELTGTNTQINIGDVWKDITGVQVNIGDVWKAVTGMQINIGDEWKTVF